ncbi:hypothetical protein NDI51_00925 [Microcoleus vaginatus GB1-A3]
MSNQILMESKRYLGLLLGWGRVYSDDWWVAKLSGEPVLTDFIEDYTNNFTIHAGAGSSTYLLPIDKRSKPAPTPLWDF